MQNKIKPLEIPLFQELHRRSQMTPDLLELDMVSEHLLFVYDDLKWGMPMNGLLKNAKYLGCGHTLESSFNLKVTPSGTTPVLLETSRVGPVDVNDCSVKGEIWAVDTQTIINLDVHMENTRLREREQKYVIFEEQKSPWKVDAASGKKPPLTRQCHMYIGLPQVWDTCTLHFTNKTNLSGRNYYHWTKTSRVHHTMH